VTEVGEEHVDTGALKGRLPWTGQCPQACVRSRTFRPGVEYTHHRAAGLPSVCAVMGGSRAMSFQKVSRYRLYQDVVGQLVEHIRSGRIRPGERFPSERELERQMGVSRGILREAFRVLEVRGIIESRPGGGRFLRQLDGQSLFDLEAGFVRLEKAVLLDICEARQIIEVRAAQLAAERGKDEEISHIGRVINDFFSTQFDLGEQMDRDLDFHVAVARSTGNLVIWELVRVLVGILREHRQQMHLPREEWATMCRQHCHIYEAIRGRDGPEAARRMAEHLDRLRKALQES